MKKKLLSQKKTCTKPVISVIIATYNAEKYINSCLRSIIKQKNRNVELIIIDGASTDQTLQVIKAYEQHIDYSISEKDKGIYDAWNKGIKRAKGNWVMFLGADDELVDGALQNYFDFIKNTSEIFDLISARVQMIDLKGKNIRIIGDPFLWPGFKKGMQIAHPGALHSLKFFEEYGLYDTNYKIVGDYELLLRAGAKIKAGFIPKITVKMREGGASDSIQAIWEAQRAVTTTGGDNRVFSVCNACWITLKYSIKKSARKFGFNIYLRR